MQILELKIENFLRVEAAEIHPDGAMVVLTGKNGAGKSSILNAIWAALGGAEAAPSEPIHAGAERAQINVSLGEPGAPELLVERVFTEKGTRLRVTSPDGRAQYRSPQEMLTGLVGALTFDPLAFAAMDDKKREALLRTLVGLDTSDLEEQHATTYRERTELNRELRAMGDTAYEEEELAEPINVGEERTAHAAAERDHRHYLDLLNAVERARSNLEAQGRRVDELKGMLDRAVETHLEHAHLLERADAALAAATDVDPEPIMERIVAASDHNRAIEIYENKIKRHDAAEALRTDIQKKTTRLGEIETEKKARIAQTKMPIEGLGIGEKGVTLDTFPFDQGNFEKRLRASMGIGMALNPTLKIMRVELGSLLDSVHFEIVATTAIETGYQVWMERVTDTDTGVGLYIVDGAIYDRDQPKAGEGEQFRCEGCGESLSPDQVEVEEGPDGETALFHTVPADDAHGSPIQCGPVMLYVPMGEEPDEPTGAPKMEVEEDDGNDRDDSGDVAEGVGTGGADEGAAATQSGGEQRGEEARVPEGAQDTGPAARDSGTPEAQAGRPE